MRIPITLEIEMSDKQAADYVTIQRLPSETGKVYAREVVERVRAGALAALRADDLGEYAEISIKGR